MNKKLVIIGAGSSYTPELIEGIIKHKSTIGISTIALVDIETGKERLKVIYDLTKRMLQHDQLDIEVTMYTDRKLALPGADFVLTQIRVGGMDSRISDESIPLKYKLIGQETTGAGGFSKAVRTIPVILDICKDIEILAKDAVLINFTNPAGIITETISKYTNLKVLGLCNVPINMKVNVAKMMSYDLKDMYMEFQGLNHFVYGSKVMYQDQDVTQAVLDQLKDGGSVSMNNIPDLKWDDSTIDRIKMVPCPYHKYFYLRDQMLEEELNSYKTKGITRGVEVKAIEKILFDKYKAADLKQKPIELEARGGSLYSEAAISLIDSITNDRGDIHTINIPNKGLINGIEDDQVIEVNCKVFKDRVQVIKPTASIDHVIDLIKEIKKYETKTIEAVMNESLDQAREALGFNPLVDNDVIDSLLDDLIKSNGFKFI